MNGWLRCWLPTIAALAALPLLATVSNGQTACTSDALKQAVAQLQDRQRRAGAQKKLQQCGETAVKPLTDALNNPVAITRLYAAQTLGQIGWEAKATVPELVAVSREDRNLSVRSQAILALSAIAQSSQTQADQLQWWQLKEIHDRQDLQQQLDKLLAALETDKTNWNTKAQDVESLRLRRNALQTKLRDLTDRPTYQIVSWVQKNPWIAAGGVLLVVMLGAYGGIFVVKPIWLLKLGEGQVKAIAGIPKVGPVLSGLLQGLSPLKYHPRVLDAWVKQYISNVRRELLQHPTFRRHDIHIAQPVFRQNNPKPVAFEPAQFTDIFKRKFRLLIYGEGGAGKTSLACQFAHWAMWGRVGEQEPYQDDPKLIKKLCQHRMIPVLLEEKLGEKSLLDAIGATLKEYTGADEISNDLLLKLLQQRRVLVIVDHLSEITDESTHQKIRPSQNQDYPVNALIVTSRDPAILGTEAVTRVQPGRITTTNLANFLNQYLPEKQKREGILVTFNPNDYADAYKDLGNMISLRQAAEVGQNQQPGTTILLVKLYADQMIVEKQKREKLGEHYFTKNATSFTSHEESLIWRRSPATTRP
jgi:hypothetical protein